MYKKSAKFYDALYHFRDYKKASERLSEIINKYNPQAKSLLDIACGTGKHIEHIKNFINPEGLDLNEELLEIAKERCPEIKFHLFDMTDFQLNKKYDVVTCLFSSVAYARTIQNLKKAVSAMSEHLNPGGLLIIEPWFSKEKFWLDRVTANHYDEKDLKITWMYTSKLEGDCALLDINYLVGTPEEVSYFKEKHVIGLFSDTEYRASMEESGISVNYDPDSLFGKGVGNGIYIGIKK